LDIQFLPGQLWSESVVTDFGVRSPCSDSMNSLGSGIQYSTIGPGQRRFLDGECTDDQSKHSLPDVARQLHHDSRLGAENGKKYSLTYLASRRLSGELLIQRY